MTCRTQKLLRLVAFVSLIGIMCIPASGIAQEVKFLRMATSVPQGSWYGYGAKICQMLENAYPGLAATAMPGGGVQNCKTVDKGGNTTVAWSYANTVASAFAGISPFNRPLQNLRHVASLYVNVLHIAVQKGEGIKEIPDLINKNIAVGPKSFSWARLIEVLFKQYGFDYQKIGQSGGTVNYIGGTQANKMFQDGNLDATMIAVPSFPFPVLLFLDKTPGFDFVGVPDEYADKMLSAVPGLVKATIPGGAYRSVAKDTSSIGAVTMIICNKDLPEQFVYMLTKLIWEEKSELAKINKVIGGVKVNDALRGAKLPTHPGALKYYKEIGIQ